MPSLLGPLHSVKGVRYNRPKLTRLHARTIHPRVLGRAAAHATRQTLRPQQATVKELRRSHTRGITSAYVAPSSQGNSCM
jgi:hypothetical protein